MTREGNKFTNECIISTVPGGIKGKKSDGKSRLTLLFVGYG